jgi:hypothetical protein
LALSVISLATAAWPGSVERLLDVAGLRKAAMPAATPPAAMNSATTAMAEA